MTDYRITCAYCGWSCRCASFSLACDERDEHERKCPECAAEIEPVEVRAS